MKTIFKKLYSVAKWGSLFFWLMYVDARHVYFVVPTLDAIADSIDCVTGYRCSFKDVRYRAIGGGVFDKDKE